MILTKRKAIELSCELWEWIAKTGGEKEDWPEWERNGGKYPSVHADCFLCGSVQGSIAYAEPCDDCPYHEQYGDCFRDGSPFFKWQNATTKEEAKYWATIFLKELEALKEEE